MDFTAIYHFLFETYAGIGILIAVSLVISLIYAVIAERKTRRVYQDKGEASTSWFGDDEEDHETKIEKA